MHIAAFSLRDHKLGNTPSIDAIEEIEKDNNLVDYVKDNPIKKFSNIR